jgi:hypothetical protein
MGGTLTKIHRGFPVRITTRMGNVSGRHAARVTAGEVGREVGGIVGFLTGQGTSIRNVTGSLFDRVLSSAMGEPLLDMDREFPSWRVAQMTFNPCPKNGSPPLSYNK